MTHADSPVRRIGLVGTLGVIGLTLAAPQLIDAAPVAHSITDLPRWAQIILLPINPLLFVWVGAWAGRKYANGVGLRSQLAEQSLPPIVGWYAWVRSTAVRVGPMPIAAGILIAVATIASDALVFMPHMSPAMREIARDQPFSAPAVLGMVFYGALAEEVILRWGLLAALATFSKWLLSTRPIRATGPIGSVWAKWIAIVTTSLVFALGHLPPGGTIPSLDAWSTARILVLNGAAGIAFGSIAWRICLEAAMLAHAVALLLLMLH